MIRTLALCILAACGDGSDEGGPRIVDFLFYSQFDADPHTAVFLFTFTAPASIDTGTANFFIGRDSEPRVSYEMSKLLLASGVASTAKRGEVVATLRFGGDNPQSGDVDVYLQLVDNDGLKSNKARVTVHLQYDEL